MSQRISRNMEEALNDQIQAELASAYLYLSMSFYFEGMTYPGFASWMSVQAQEEVMHAKKLAKYVNERSARVTLKTLEQPKKEWASVTEVFSDALNHEIKVTGLINDLVKFAESEKDYTTQNFLQWFVAEQVEEESSVRTIVDTLAKIKDSTVGLVMLDKELGTRG